MQFPDLFKVLADYLGFVADFLSCRCMETHIGKRVVDPALASYFVAGVLIAYLFATATRVPGYESNSRGAAGFGSARAQTPSEPFKEQTADMVRFVLVSILGAALAHFCLLAANWIVGGVAVSSMQTTINAALAFNAVYHPANAIAKNLSRVLRNARDEGRVKARAATAFLVLLGAVPVGLVFYWLHAMATVHQTGVGYMVAVQGIGVVLLALATCLVGLPLLKDDGDEDEDAEEPSAA